eukprot:scaffold317779_cov44-Prasinocladus_malaysianus.AAC.1
MMTLSRDRNSELLFFPAVLSKPSERFNFQLRRCRADFNENLVPVVIAIVSFSSFLGDCDTAAARRRYSFVRVPKP